MLALLGGVIGGLFWGLGQESKYRCAQCERVFYSHTPLSRTFLALAVLTYVGIGALLFGTFFLSPKH